MVASSLENALVSEFPISTLYGAYVSIVLVQKIACVQTCRPHNSMSPVFLVVQSRVPGVNQDNHSWCRVRIVVFGVGQFLCCVNLPGVTWSNYFTSTDLFNNFFCISMTRCSTFGNQEGRWHNTLRGTSMQEGFQPTPYASAICQSQLSILVRNLQSCIPYTIPHTTIPTILCWENPVVFQT